MILDHLGGPSIITRVLIGGRGDRRMRVGLDVLKARGQRVEM